MIFGFTPVAEASIVTLMKSIDKVIINPIIFFLFASALAYFLYGLAKYLLNPDNEEIRKQSKTQIITGIFGLFIMVAVFGIMKIILNTVGGDKIIVKNNGDYQVDNYNLKSTQKKKDNNFGGTIGVTGDAIDIRSNSNIDLTNVKGPPVNYTRSPFRIKYISNRLCAREIVHVSAPIEYQAIAGVKQKAKDAFNGQKPLNFGLLTAYDSSTKLYHSWMDARLPFHGGTSNNCVLAVDTKAMGALSLNDLLPGSSNSPTNTFTPVDESSRPSIFNTVYSSDDLFYRVQASGVSPLLTIARNIAIKNAYLLLGIKLKDVNNMTIVYPTAKILEEKYIVDPDGNYDYWVALETPRSSVSGGGSSIPSGFTSN